MGNAVLDLGKISNMDLVNIINETEGRRWRLNHEVAHGNAKREEVEEGIAELTKTRNQAVEEVKRRTGIETLEELRNYIRKELGKQNDEWDDRFRELCNEGSVFVYSSKQDLQDITGVEFETVRTYISMAGGPNEYLLSRIRGTTRFRMWDDRNIPQLHKVEGATSLYTNLSPFERGLIKAHEEPSKRKVKANSNSDEFETGKNAAETSERNVYGKNIHDFYSSNLVLFHKGFNQTLEVLEYVNLPYTSVSEENAVLLTRSHDRKVLIELTNQDVGLLEFVSAPSKFSSFGSRYFDLDKQDF